MFLRKQAPVLLLAAFLAVTLAGCAGRNAAPEYSGGHEEAPLSPPPATLPSAPPQISEPDSNQPPLESPRPDTTNLPARPAASQAASKPAPRKAPPVPATWHPLLERLAADGLAGKDIHRLFATLGDSYSPKPMGTKIKELFTSKYLRDRSVKKPAASAPRVYPGFLTPEKTALCRGFLDTHAPYFALAEKRYGVPGEIIVALLMVETRLGAYLGTNNAFWSLACMAAADSPERIAEPLEKLPMTPERLEWVRGKLNERSTWAYKELKALIIHIREQKLDPLNMPGSVYGAIGLCQFMPSNLKAYGVDGDKDGKVDLFSPADAIPSVANYLKAHGWKGAMPRARKHAVLKRYNNSNVYANTILALAETITADADKTAANQTAP